MDKEDSEENDATIQSDDTCLAAEPNDSALERATAGPLLPPPPLLPLSSQPQPQLPYSAPSAAYSANADASNHRPACSIKKLGEHEHFHYTTVNLPHIFVRLIAFNADCLDEQQQLLIEVESNNNTWIVKRSYKQLIEFDNQLHRCVFDRNYSKLYELRNLTNISNESIRIAVDKYLQRLSQLTANSITCFPILRFLEVDSRGNRFLPAEETSINTPAIATAIVTKNYTAKKSREISLKVGDIVSIIEKRPPNSEGVCWWKAKLTIANNKDDLANIGFRYKVGFFPSDCVQLFDGKSTITNGSLKLKPKRVARPRERSLMRVFLRRGSPQRIIPVFGTDLVEYLQKTGYDVPIILKKCVEIIERYGIVTGVYRQCGIQSNVQKLRNAFDSGLISDAFNEGILRDVHCVSSLLKQYFRQLPNPLFTFTLYSKFIVAYETRDETRSDKFKSVIEQLPNEHYRTAKYLISHLAKLSRCAHLTDMNSKNLAIVWAPNLFRSPPCQSNSDVRALQGLNVQTGLCNYIILHAVHLFSLNDESASWTENEKHNAPSITTREKSPVRASDFSYHKLAEVNSGGSSSVLTNYHTVLDRPVKKSHGKNKSQKKPLVSTQSAEDTGTKTKEQWRAYGNQCSDHPASADIKWRRSLSPENNEIRTSRSTSLITFVAKSVEEFRNGVFYGWRTKNACNRRNAHEGSAREPNNLAERCPTNKMPVNSLNSETGKHRLPHLVAQRNYDLMPSTSAELGGLCASRRHESESSASSRGDFDSQHIGESHRRNLIRDRRRLQVAFDDKPSKVLNENSAKTMGTTPSSVSSSFRSSTSDESLQLDISRYDNVTPQTRGVDRLRLAETPLSFYDLPQDNISNCQTNVQFYYL